MKCQLNNDSWTLKGDMKLAYDMTESFPTESHRNSWRFYIDFHPTQMLYDFSPIFQI